MRAETGEAERDGTREALTRVLAIESRNALARVELAASELSRFEFSPSVGDRIATIHDAVGQIDGLLAKIDLLASPQRLSRSDGVLVQSVWRRIRERLEPTLVARGIRLDTGVKERDVEAEVFVDMPGLALESVLCALLRVVLASVRRDESLRFEVARGQDAVSIAFVRLNAVAGTRDWRFDRASQIELEVQLAEWGARLEEDEEGTAVADGHRLGILLPVSAFDG